MRFAPLHRTSLLALAVLASAAAAQAADLNTVRNLNQTEFRDLSEDLGAALSFKPLIPSESMGVTGFDVGVAVTGTRLEHPGVWAKASNGSAPETLLPTAQVRVHKGLPFDIDIGASLASTSTNARAVGGELRWAVLPGSTLLPAVALRASATSLTNVSQISLQTYGLDVSISKGFAMLTPYAGVGTVLVRSRADTGTGLEREAFNQAKVFAGLNVNLGLANLAFEADRTGDASSYGVKAGFRF